MITKEQLLGLATELGLLSTTVNKDYALGWLLVGIGEHPVLSKWVFKGGTCLKKAYFDTYRFSEDLDFTVPQEEPYDRSLILQALKEAGDIAYEKSGVEFLKDEIQVNESVNKRQAQTFAIKVPFQGPLRQNNKSIQRITFDITQDEILAATPDLRTIFHGYSDAPTPPAKVRCYSINEIIAEKTRALYERQGRSRDVYDAVNISRNFRKEIDASEAKRILEEKFRFKDLPFPTVDLILARIDHDLLKQSWSHQLAHQLPALPPVDSFITDLEEALKWWIEGRLAPMLASVPLKTGEVIQAKERFSSLYPIGRGSLGYAPSLLNQIRFAARNQMCVALTYGGVTRVVEPYSLRIPKTGNLLLYAYELLRGNAPGGGIKAFKVVEIQQVQVTNRAFSPRYQVEL